MLRKVEEGKGMTLSERQQHFTLMVSMLIDWAYKNSYELTFGEAYRTKEQAEIYAKEGKGIKNSKHCQRLAIDFNLFIDGIYQTDTEAYRPLGEFWKSLNPDNKWGGDFIKLKDGNHLQFGK